LSEDAQLISSKTADEKDILIHSLSGENTALRNEVNRLNDQINDLSEENLKLEERLYDTENTLPDDQIK
jgi:predicted nuclease with TOPRIM domain